MSLLTQGQFTIDTTGSKGVTVGDGHSADNQIQVVVTNAGAAQPRARVTVTARCGTTEDALLDVSASTVTATCAGQTLLRTADATSVTWQTSSKGIALDTGKTLISLSGFESNTPPGKAVLDVLVQVMKDAGWSPAIDDQSVARALAVTKGVAPSPGPRIHYFNVNPDYVLHAGETAVTSSFHATGCATVALYRNNHAVRHWPSNENPKNPDGSITGTFSDTPSITTTYRLDGMPGSGKPQEVRTRVRTVQVISPGWNQIAPPQGYPARLFVANDFSGSGVPRLYGIFIDGNGAPALYSSATGVDDWRLEPGTVQPHMAMSPGAVYDGKLWLIGGSCVSANQAGSQVWCYEPDPVTGQRDWKQHADFTGGPRMGHACVVVPRKEGGTTREELWVLGGYNNGTCFNDVWRFPDPKTRTWSQIVAASRTWTPRLMHAAACFRPDPPARGEDAPPPEVYVYGGTDIPAPERGVQDLWVTSDGASWRQLVTRDSRGIVPPPGPPLAAALVTNGGAAAHGMEGPATAARLFLAGTFLESADSNRITSLIFESKRRNNVWQQSPVVDGWEQFEGGFFYMQAVAFNGFLFVWSLLGKIAPSALPKLNILVPR